MEKREMALQINYESLEQFFQDYAANASFGRIFIQASDPLPVGTAVRIMFNVPQLNQLIETTGVVAHVIGAEDHAGGTGMGVHFNDIDNHCKDLIDALMIGRPLSYACA